MKGEFYKMEYEAWDQGCVGMTMEQVGAYLTLCHQMYRWRGPVKEDLGLLARLWNCHQNKARKLLADLIETGKIQRQDGHLTNTRVTQEIHARETHHTRKVDAGKTGGRRSADNRKKANEINDDGQALASTSLNQRREEKRREEKNDSPLPPEGDDGDDFPSSDEGHDNPSVRTRPAREPRKFAWPRDWFDQFWNRYPKKEGKKKTLDLLDAVRRKDETAFEVVMSGLEQYRSKIEDPKFYMQPERWVRGERWNDEKVDQIDRPRPTIASQRRVAL